jgi:RHS repeat-associated protein
MSRLVEWKLNGVSQKTWSLDSLGNDLAAGTYNTANEETPTQGSSGYDLAGNMTTLQSGKTAVYDAWNRLVEVDDGETIVQRHEYDGANRRIQVFSDFDGSTPDKVVDEYLSGQQVIESDVTVDGDRDGGYQYLWSPRYIDAAILRDTLTTNGSGVVAAQRVFYLADANYNVTGLVKYDSGTEQWQVAERNTYTPYGLVTYRNPDWTTAGSSANANSVLYTGRTLDLLTSLHYYRARYYDAGLERFIGRDPIGYVAGANLYTYVNGRPTVKTDPNGKLAHGVAAAVVTAASACLVPYFFAGRHYYPDDEFMRHCWTSCMAARTCSTAISFAAGLGFELVTELILAIHPDFDTDWANTMFDLMNNAMGLYCAGWESAIPIAGNIGRLFRESCECCCKRER